MWQRFTERARKAVFFAQEEAQHMGHDYVSPDHLLLGLVRERDSLSSKVLTTLSVDIDALVDTIRSGMTPEDKRSANIALTPLAKRVIDNAYDEARNLNNNYIGTEHLILGILRIDEGLSARTLVSLGVSLESTRRTVMDAQNQEEFRQESKKGPFDFLKERVFGKSPAPTQGPEALPVSYDLQTLHPVDLLLISLLSDRNTALGARLREQSKSLDWILPAIVASMVQSNDNDASIQEVLAKASKLASEKGRTEIDAEDLYEAAYSKTTDATRAILSGMNLTPET